jgi:hypothetical protein
MRSAVSRLGWALVALSPLVLGCQPKIGDPCRRSIDCSWTGERICDLSNRVNDQGIPTPGGRGECIVEGCGRGGCPSEAACVKVYGSTFLSVACDPEREDRATVDENGELLPPLDDCSAHEICLPEGLCADELNARTSCRRECKRNRDCRDGYRCVETGWGGVYQAPDLDDPSNDSETKICMPVATF